MLIKKRELPYHFYLKINHLFSVLVAKHPVLAGKHFIREEMHFISNEHTISVESKFK